MSGTCSIFSLEGVDILDSGGTSASKVGDSISSSSVSDLMVKRTRAWRLPNPNRPLPPSSRISISTALRGKPRSSKPFSMASSTVGAIISKLVRLSFMFVFS